VREIRVHSWGGFGSQLNALALALHIRDQHRTRPIKIVIHTSGVTERNLEIQEVTPPSIALEVINDFNPYFKSGHVQKSFRNSISRSLEYLKIVVKPNDDVTLKSLRFWTLSTRGHYSKVSFSSTVLNSLLELLKIDSWADKNSGNICHYRLGDLLSLEKGFINASRLVTALTEVTREAWCVLSDSTAVAEQMMTSFLPKEMQCTFEYSEPISVIRRCVGASNFVGTNSKLSIWIAIFRAHLGKSNTYMPESLKSGLVGVMSNNKLELISFYE
jgi:hypothetical protein